MKTDKKYQKELFKRLSGSSAVEKEMQLFNKLFEKPIFWLLEQTKIKDILPLTGVPVCSKAKGFKKKECLKCLSRTLRAVKKSKKLKQFVCPGGYLGFCLPLIRGDAFYGFVLLCHLKTSPSNKSLRLFEALNSEILENVQKELELSKLYETIRPRAVALSTIHTIRRLISFSLDLDELLPKIARLTLQVLRAKRCAISLVDEKTGHLVHKTVIDISKKKAKPRPSSTMRHIENKVRRTGNTLLEKSYLSVPLIDEKPKGVITVFKKMSKKPFNNFDREILTALSEQAVGAIKNAQLYKEQENMLFATVKSLSGLLKVKSAYPYVHPKAFIDIALGIAKELKLSEKDSRDLRFAAMLHDAEKVGIPEEILKKPAQLTGKEFKLIKEYPKKGAKILSPLECLQGAIAIILHHHEKFDGSGYPGRLKGEKIPLGARIMTVADSFMAMVSRRPYRKSISSAEAIKELKRQSGKQFDPRVIEAFLRFTKNKSFKKLIRGTHRG